jgi:hypothetical protein
MWIFTPIGFFSVVKKEHDAEDEITIRARVRADLEALKAYVASMSEIREDRNADYWYRATAKHEDFAEAAAQLVRDIDYSNFKNQVASKQGYDRSSRYGEVWSVMYELQRSEGE